MRYKYILFDLDGTLTDAKIGLTKSVQFALKKMGINENPENLTHYIGPPLKDALIKYQGFSEEEAWKAVMYFREYFTNKGMFENILYDGIKELLQELKKKNISLYVATSKPTVFAKQIIEHFDLNSYFEGIFGADLELKKATKSDVIIQILEMHPDIDKKQCVIIGDREHDLIGAQQTGIDSIAVGFGYGSESELQGAKPTYYVKTVSELSELLLR